MSAAPPRKPLIFGLAGLSLREEERAFFAAHRPAGYILFGRNCDDPEQLQALTRSLKDLCPDYHPLILIDQEGGRVARLRPPHWRDVPPAAFFARHAADDPQEAARLVYLNARLIAAELIAAGINTDCAPLADLPDASCHDIIGDRAFGDTASQVSRLARAMADGLADGGILPVLKHIPGHGRAEVDSHEALPVVDTPLATLRMSDFLPFRDLADLPLGMTAHIRYTAIDPREPATLSQKTIALVREEIGFRGLLMTDDLSMKALKGDFGDLARRALEAGCDLVLHCNGVMAEMQPIGDAVGFMPPAQSALIEELLQSAARRKKSDDRAINEEYHLLAIQSGLTAKRKESVC